MRRTQEFRVRFPVGAYNFSVKLMQLYRRKAYTVYPRIFIFCVQNKELDEKFYSTELEELQTKLEKQEQQRMIEVEEMKKEKEQLQKIMESDFSEMKKELEKEFWKDVELKMKNFIDQGLVVYKGD